MPDLAGADGLQLVDHRGRLGDVESADDPVELVTAGEVVAPDGDAVADETVDVAALCVGGHFGFLSLAGVTPSYTRA